MPSKQPSSARGLALRTLREVSQGAFASESIDQTLRKSLLAEADRGLFTQLVYGVLRERGYLDQVLARYISKAATPEALLDLLRLAAYQCLSLDKVPDYAAVHEAVELAKAKYGPGAGRLVNAVLRGLLRERQEIDTKLGGSRLESYPDWMLRRWRKRYPQAKLQGMLEYFAAPAALWARVNLRKTTHDALLGESVGIESAKSDDALIDLGGHDRSIWLKWMEAGLISIQDRHSYRVAMAVEPHSGDSILDACAGHGGKSSAMIEAVPDCHLFVHDPSEERILQLKENFARLGHDQPAVITGSAAAMSKGLRFDAILIDAPCSGMGTLGRKPEIRWRLKPEDLKRLALKQRAILDEWSPLLKPGGRLVYAVCSLEPEEGRENIAHFLTEHPELRLGEEWELFPAPDAGDGFYVARLQGWNESL
jgi:16S rRNA (cytosine967-C5)-methyltransferase